MHSAPSTNSFLYSAIKIVIGKTWANQGERAIMVRLKEIISGSSYSLDGPFGPRAENEGYRYQIDASNDWWAELNMESPPSLAVKELLPVLTVAYRYNGVGGSNRLRALAEWAAFVFNGRVLHPHVYPWHVAKEGGQWLGAARSWMQHQAVNGSEVTWGSQELLNLRGSLTVKDVEDLAAEVAGAALNERNTGRL